MPLPARFIVVVWIAAAALLADRATAEDAGPVNGGPVPLNALPNAGYVAQSIHQEAMGSGLTIEPWSEAIDAYRRADAGVNTPLVTQIAV